MLGVLLGLLVLLIVFAIIWWIVGMIPIPPEFRWIVNVVIGVLFLIALLGLVFGGIPFPSIGGTPAWRHP